jgi:ribosomal protein S8
MLNKFKNILSKLMIAQNKKLFFIQIPNKKSTQILLNFLWIEGLISGYYIYFNRSFLIVFLKKIKKYHSLIENISFLNGFHKNLFFKNICKTEKKTIFFVLNDKGIFLHKSVIKIGLGGFKISKI